MRRAALPAPSPRRGLSDAADPPPGHPRRPARDLRAGLRVDSRAKQGDMTPDPAALLPVAFEAITTASEMMRTQRPASLTEKDDRDLVSDVDVAIERAVRTRLRTATPGIGFLGEEEGRTGDPATGWLWTLDP